MIRLAILGAGIGAQHLDAYRQLPQLFKVVYIVDLDEEKAKSLIDRDDEITVTKDIDVALIDPTIDVIDICLPPHLHVQFTLQALDAGKHVICEKPLATSLRDALRVQKTAETAGKDVFPVFQYRWGPPLAGLRALIQNGIAGKPHMAALETHWSRGADYYSVPWRGTWKGEQGGAVLGHSIHSHDLLTHFMGPVAAVSATTATRINDIETEDCAAISFEMVNGALATSNITLGAATNETRLRFVFENITVTSGTSPYLPGAEPWAFTAKDFDMQNSVDAMIAESTKEPLGYIGLFSSIFQKLTSQSYACVGMIDGIASIELVSAIYQSAHSKMRVSLPLGKDSAYFEGWNP